MQDAAGMAKALLHLAKNATTDGRELMADTNDFTIDEAVQKIRIHYEKYVG